jgi:putative ABC transport system permease protein
VGTAIGLALAMMTMQGIRSVLFGITALDPVSFMIAPAILLPIMLLACLAPALRASRVDPVGALRSE